MKIEYAAACPFCGQLRTFETGNYGLSAEEQSLYVAKHCTCEKAEEARWIDRTEDAIQNVLGPECIKKGFDYEVDDDTIAIVRRLVDEIAKKHVNNVTFVEPNGDTIKLNRGSDRIKIGRVCKKQIVM